jgi:hypothetical protein
MFQKYQIPGFVYLESEQRRGEELQITQFYCYAICFYGMRQFFRMCMLFFRGRRWRSCNRA